MTAPPTLGAMQASSSLLVAATPSLSEVEQQARTAFDTYGPMALTFTLRLLGVAVLLALTWTLAGWISRRTHSVLARAKVDLTLTKFTSTGARWGVLALGVVAALGMFGVQTASFAVVLGSIGLAIGLGFQGALSNFAAGVLLLLFRPFRVGDVVVLSGVRGTVDEIGLVYTSVDTPDNRRVMLPNGPLLNATIENITFHPKRRVDVAIGTAYEGGVDAARGALTRAAQTLPERLADMPVDVDLLEFGPSSINWSVRVWAKSADFGRTRQALARAVKASLDAEEIAIPFPQMDVHVRTGDPLPNPGDRGV